MFGCASQEREITLGMTQEHGQDLLFGGSGRVVPRVLGWMRGSLGRGAACCGCWLAV